MASNDFVENAIASNVDESAVSELACSLENSISNPGVLGHPGGGPAGMTTVHPSRTSKKRATFMHSLFTPEIATIVIMIVWVAFWI